MIHTNKAAQKSCLFFVVAIFNMGIHAPVHAQEEPPNYSEEKLTGDWGGLRTQLYNSGYGFELDYTVNSWRNFKGGNDQGNRVGDNLSFGVDIDGEKAFGAQGASAHISLLNNFGGRINDLVGSNGGIDNMEVPSGAGL